MKNAAADSHRAGGLHPGLAVDLHGQPPGRPGKKDSRKMEGWKLVGKEGELGGEGGCEG